MSLVTEFLHTCKEGFANKDSSSVGGFITDDFEMITPVRKLRDKGYGYKRIAGEYTRLTGEYVSHTTVHERLMCQTTSY